VVLGNELYAQPAVIRPPELPAIKFLQLKKRSTTEEELFLRGDNFLIKV
jgi:hypothetical protein